MFDKVLVRIWIRSTRDRKELIIVDLLEPKILTSGASKNKRLGSYYLYH